MKKLRAPKLGYRFIPEDPRDSAAAGPLCCVRNIRLEAVAQLSKFRAPQHFCSPRAGRILFELFDQIKLFL